MSTKYPGGLISKTPPVPTGPFENGAAPGIWTLEQQAAYVKQGIWPIAGNVDPSAFIENLFQTWVYTGNGSTQTITNGIDLTGKGGMVWVKSRTSATSNVLGNTVNGVPNHLLSNTTNANQSWPGYGITAYNSNGFSVADDGGAYGVNGSGSNYASWTFRKQPKFFDVVTWTGTGANRTIAHSLGSVPGCIIVKRTDTTADWQVYHRSLANTQYMVLNSTAAVATGATRWNSTTPTSTEFSLGSVSTVNASGGTYVAYVFAHDSGGFGLSGTDNVISCGSFISAGFVDLGWEPQWVFYKRTNGTGNWSIYDNMRGMLGEGYSGFPNSALFPNLSNAESSQTGITITPTGFSATGNSGSFIYIAIRRGPMAVPTTGTSVFAPVARSGTGSTSTVSNGITTDLIISMVRNSGGTDSGVWDRLRGFPAYLATTALAAESTSSDSVTAMNNTAYVLGADGGTDRINRSGNTYANWTFGRAPGFMDVCCYTGTGVTSRAITHNLTVVPEMIIYKSRSLGAEHWGVYTATTGIGKTLWLDAQNNAQTLSQRILAVSSSTFTVGDNDEINQSAATYVAYLFATCPGVSKVGGYIGTGTTLQIDCGFTTGARFVLIKRTDSTGDWYVWDSARGIVAGNDPYLLLNSTAAEVTGTDYVDTASTGFEISSTAPAAINASGGTFIFLAIA
jgi:hypothetical protein